MDTQNNERELLLMAIERMMVLNGMSDFSKDVLQSINEEDCKRYLEYKGDEDFNLSAEGDAETEMKVSTCILRYLHKAQPDNGKEKNEQIYKAVIAGMRAYKVQYWWKCRQINQSQYEQYLDVQRKAEIIAEIKYRMKTSLVGTGTGAALGLKIVGDLGKEGIPVDPQTAGLIVGGLALLGLFLGLFLSKDDIDKIEKWAKENIVPKLKEYMESRLKGEVDKMPQELSDLTNLLTKKLREYFAQKQETVTETVESKAEEATQKARPKTVKVQQKVNA